MSRMLTSLLRKPDAKDYLEGAVEAARWLRSVETKTDHGSYWAQHPTRGEGFGQLDLTHGTAGVLVLFLQLAEATGDASYLEDAKRGGDFIVHELDAYGIDYLCSNMRRGHYLEGIHDSLKSGGAAGVAYILTELNKYVPDENYTRLALSLTDTIVNDAVPAPGGIMWSGKSGVNFDSGTILYLLYAAKAYDRPDWVETAASAGRAILTTGVKQEIGGVKFTGFRNMVRLMEGFESDEYDVPNFVYGSSGIGFTFARLYEETGDEAFLTGAREAAAYIAGVAQVEGDAALLPYRLPDLPDVHYLSTCHGNVGTARLFYILSDVTGEACYREWLEKIANGILATGAPELHSPGYWNCYSVCCGTAGFAHLFAALYLKSGDERYLSAARRCGFVMLRQASREEGGLCWHQAFKRIDPDDISVETGYDHGAAGIATALLHIYLAEQGKAPILRMPDESYLRR